MIALLSGLPPMVIFTNLLRRMASLLQNWLRAG